ncbi:MAG: hypothetical protein Q6373_018835 [Candidatus Sigynarchaeota archaeon]
MSIKKKEVVSHPNVVKLISVLSTLFIIGTLAVNGYNMVAGYMLSWGFYPNRTVPNVGTYSNATHLVVYIPAYVNNSGAIGFDVKDLRIDVSLSYASNGSLITSSTSNIGDIPFGTNKCPFNVTLVSLNTGSLLSILNSTTPFVLGINFHVSYIFATTTLSATIELPGGLSFP